MTRLHLVLVTAGVAAGALVFHAQTPAAQLAHKFIEIAPGVYSATGTGAINAGSNSAVIVNQEDILIVDSHMTPDAGRALLRDVKTLSDKPVKFLVNTHFHYDHADGNQVFAPVADVIGHDYTRKRLSGDILQRGMFADLLNSLPKQIDD